MPNLDKIPFLLIKGSKFIGCDLTNEQVSQFAKYFQLLWEWNKKVNLTGLKTPEEIIASLFIDSLAPRNALLQSQVDSITDVGSGAGFPGLVLKIAIPDLRVTLLEPQLKKAAFLDYVIGTLGLSMVTVIPKRIEEVKKNRFPQKATAITVKALSPFPILSCLRQLLSESGRLYLWRAKPLDEKYLAGIEIENEILYELPFGQGKRTIVILKFTNR